MEKSKKSINVDLCRVEFFKISKRDVTFIREMRVVKQCKSLFTFFQCTWSSN